MMNVEIEPNYLAHDEDASEADQADSSVVDQEEYGEEGLLEGNELGKIKRDKVFM